MRAKISIKKLFIIFHVCCLITSTESHTHTHTHTNTNTHTYIYIYIMEAPNYHF